MVRIDGRVVGREREGEREGEGERVTCERLETVGGVVEMVVEGVVGYLERGRYLQDVCEEPPEHGRAIHKHDHEQWQRSEDVRHLGVVYEAPCVCACVYARVW